jgi:hypothetical protein
LLQGNQFLNADSAASCWVSADRSSCIHIGRHAKYLECNKEENEAFTVHVCRVSKYQGTQQMAKYGTLRIH